MKAPSLKLLLPFGIAVIFAAASPAIWSRMAPAKPETVPVIAGQDAGLDACGAEGTVFGLDPNGNGYLAVRAGPGSHYAELDRLENGQSVFICDHKGKWLGIVYTHMPATDCGVARAWQKPAPYGGPCNVGWVYENWIKEIAG